MMEQLLNIISELSLDNIIYHLLGFICHQDKTILLSVGNSLIPFCPRCLGLHAGFFLTLAFIKLFLQKPINVSKPWNLFIIIFSICVAGVHWLLGFFDLIEMNFTSRVFTGLVSGAGFCFLLNSLKYRYLQTEFALPSRNKILLTCLLVLLLPINLSGDYSLLLLSILVIVTCNIISIINSIWQLISLRNNNNYSFITTKEIQS